MGRFIGEAQLRRIKDAVDLVDVMSDYAPPQRAGRQFKVCCPFHQERSPSCYLYPEQQTYHCFGCGAHGDVITLVREQEGLDFVDAMEYLARRAGISIVYEDVGPRRAEMPKSERELLLAAMTFARDWYQEQLWTSQEAADARSYLAERGIGRDLAQQFQLGWAPGRGLLCQAARQAGHQPQHLLQCNLAQERDQRINDRFYERIMFPICDRFGQTLAFSGRILPAAEAAAKEAGRSVGKYINSSDTPLYHKSEVVWNLHQARSHARKGRRIVVMEGPTDVIAAAGAGLQAAVAVLGTALTTQHARQLANVLGGDGHVTLLFDGDRAGQENALKAVATCLGSSVPCRVAIMPEGLDPAQLLQERGLRALEQLLLDDRSDIDHLLRSVAGAPRSMDPRQRLEAVDRCLEILRPIQDRELRYAYLEELASWFQIEVQRLQRRLQDQREVLEEPVEDRGEQSLPAIQEDIVLHVLIQNNHLRSWAFDSLGLEPSDLSEPWNRIVDILISEPSIPAEDLLNHLEIRDTPALNTAVHRWLRDAHGRGGIDLSDPEKTLADHVKDLRRRHITARIEQLHQALQEAERQGDHAESMRLFQQLRALRSSDKTD